MTLAQRIVVLNGGEIQQIDTPMRVYERPANLFVAGFVGSPAMNFVRGRLLRQEGPALDLGFMRVKLDGAAAVSTALPEGAEVVAGLRPEDLQLVAADTPTAGQRFSAQLELIEPVGNETFLTARAGNVELVMRTAPQALPQVGEPVALTFAPARLHLFDAATGLRL
jgi:multiple sugar transport system ATP-binding protein